MFCMENERWITIPNFNGRYKINKKGLVKSVKNGKMRILVESKTKNSCKLFNNGVYTRININVMVSQLFGGGNYEKSRGKRLFKEYNPEDEMPPLYEIRKMLRELKR